jgi:AcrR family transcriptional regulator
MARPRPPRARAARPTRARSSVPAGERKRDATRRTLLERALVLFQARGVDATTMRDIAEAAGLSLGAAYYYFPSKDALIFAYYEANQAEAEAAAPTTGTVRARLGALLHGKLASIRPQRAMLASIIQRLVDPGDPLSAFSSATASVRGRAIEAFARALASSGLPAEIVPLAAHALWLLQLACMLVYVHDDSPGEARTHGLVDDGLDLIVPLLPLLASPPGRAVCERMLAALARAGMRLAP